MIIRISSGVFESLLREAAVALPRECCGLVTGKPGLIEAVVPARNVSPHPETSFEIDPGTLMRTHREVREQQRHVIGHYHSHPDGNVQPSLRDAARATHNGQVWIVIAGGTVNGWHAVTPPEPDNDSPDGHAADVGSPGRDTNDRLVHGRFLPVRLLHV